MRYGACMVRGRLVGLRRHFAVSSVAFAIAMLGGQQAFAQGDAAAGAKAKPPARVAWQYAPEGASFDDVREHDGVVIALDRNGKVHALDTATGKPRWVSGKDVPMSYGFGSAISPNPDFPAVLIGCDKGLFALDYKTGKKLWFTEIALGVAGPACTDEHVVAGSGDGKVYGCDLRTGKIVWEHEYLEDAPDDPPGFDGNRARFGGKPARPRNATTDGKMVVLSVFDQCRALALDAKTGKRLWAYNTSGWMYGTPSIGPRNVFVGSQDKHIYAIDKEMGKLMWKVKTGARVEAGAASTERFAYFGSCDSRIYCVDQGVGRVVWKFETEHAEGYGAPIYSRAVVTGDTVYLAAMRGKVYALDRHTGALRWKFEPLAKSEINSDLIRAGDLLLLTTRKKGDDGLSAVIAIREGQ